MAERLIEKADLGSIEVQRATLTSLFAHARSRKAISSSRLKTSLPVTGNLATEIYSFLRFAIAFCKTNWHAAWCKLGSNQATGL